MKYYKISLAKTEEELEGVVIACNEEEARDKFDDEDYIKDFKICPTQRSIEFEEITKEEYEKLKNYCESK